MGSGAHPEMRGLWYLGKSWISQILRRMEFGSVSLGQIFVVSLLGAPVEATKFLGPALLGRVLASCCKNNIWSKCLVVI
jgi:hypothetical protein